MQRRNIYNNEVMNILCFLWLEDPMNIHTYTLGNTLSLVHSRGRLTLIALQSAYTYVCLSSALHTLHELRMPRKEVSEP